MRRIPLEQPYFSPAALGLMLAALLIAPGSQAGAYKCVVNGETIFSQLPCAEDAEEVKLRGAPPAPEPDPLGEIGQMEKAGTDTTAGADDYLERKRKEREIQGIERQIAGLEKRRDERIGKIRAQVARTTYPEKAVGLQNEAEKITRDTAREIADLRKKLRELQKD